MTAPREVNAERAMHLRAALEEIVGAGSATLAVAIALGAIRRDDFAIQIAEQDAADCDPEPS